MSGVFWEPSSQPDLMEAVTGLATSSLSLALALPMAAIDLVCTILAALAGVVVALVGLASVVVAPVAELLGQAGVLVLTTTGLEESWSTNHTLVLTLSLYTVLALGLTSSAAQQNLSKVTGMVGSLLLVAAFLSFPAFETAAHAPVGQLSLAFTLGGLCLRALFLEHAGYRHGSAATELDGTATGLAGCLAMEAMGAMVICAFGYPGLSMEDEPSRYYCLLPFLAFQCIYFTSVLKVEPVAVVTANGSVTEIKDGLSAKIQEVKEICGEKVAEVKEKIEAAVVTAIEENPEVLEAAANAEAAGQIAENKVEELVEAVTESVEAIGEVVETKVEEVKADPMFQRLVAALCSMCEAVRTRLAGLLAPVLSLASAAGARLAAVPWAALLLHGSTAGTHLLHAAAWHHLTGSALAAALPCLSLGLPLALDWLAPRLPAALPPYVREAGGLATAATVYLLVTGTGAGVEA